MPRDAVFVLIPGAWHRSTCYDKVSSLLQTQHGIDAYSVTLPSTSGRRGASFKEDVDAARAVIVSQLERARNVVVVAHSYGGMVGNSAIKGLMRRLPADATVSPAPAQSRQAHVIGLVLIASGFAITGVAFMAPLCGLDLPFCRPRDGFVELTKSPREFFYHDLPTAEADYHVRQLTPQSRASLYEGGEYVYAGWQDVATWYIATKNDRALPFAVQRLQVGMARGQGGDITFRELPTSHSPFLSRPEDVVQILISALREFQEEVSESPRGLQRRQALLISFWPQQWYRFGVLMGLGEMLGRCLVGFQAARRWWRS